MPVQRFFSGVRYRAEQGLRPEGEQSSKERRKRRARERIEGQLRRLGPHSWFVMRLVHGGGLSLVDVDRLSFRAALSGNLALDARAALEALEVEEAKGDGS